MSENSAFPASGAALDDIAALLAEQIAVSHAAAARCFAIGADEEDFGDQARNDALKIAARLIDACASAAQTINRIKGAGFHYRVTVDRVDVAAEKAARAARKRKLSPQGVEDARAAIERKLAKLAAHYGYVHAPKDAVLETANVVADQEVDHGIR